jgi:hypothetical protein
MTLTYSLPLCLGPAAGASRSRAWRKKSPACPASGGETSPSVLPSALKDRLWAWPRHTGLREAVGGRQSGGAAHGFKDMTLTNSEGAQLDLHSSSSSKNRVIHTPRGGLQGSLGRRSWWQGDPRALGGGKFQSRVLSVATEDTDMAPTLQPPHRDSGALEMKAVIIINFMFRH